MSTLPATGDGRAMGNEVPAAPQWDALQSTLWVDFGRFAVEAIIKIFINIFINEAVLFGRPTGGILNVLHGIEILNFLYLYIPKR